VYGYESEFLTTRKVFVNEDFKFHSQLTDVDMIEKGLDEDDTLENLEKYFKNVLDSVRKAAEKPRTAWLILMS